MDNVNIALLPVRALLEAERRNYNEALARVKEAEALLDKIENLFPDKGEEQ